MRRLVLIIAMTATAALVATVSTVSTALGAPPSATSPPAAASAGPQSQSTGTAAPAGALTTARAANIVHGRGYTPLGVEGYTASMPLSVIVGRLSTSVDGHPQQAFFFHEGRFVGTDVAASANVRWVWSTGDTVALQYDLYRPDDPMCCPSAGASTVRYHWNGSAVVPLDPIPSNSWSAPASRR